MEKFVEVHYEVYAPRVLAGLAGFKDTLEDRAIPIFMLRKRREEPVARLTQAVDAEAQTLRDQCALACLARIGGILTAYDAALALPSAGLRSALRQGQSGEVNLTRALRSPPRRLYLSRAITRGSSSKSSAVQLPAAPWAPRKLRPWETERRRDWHAYYHVQAHAGTHSEVSRLSPQVGGAI